MSSPDPLPPALTPEEWSWPHATDIGGDSPKMGIRAFASDDTGVMRIHLHLRVHGCWTGMDPQPCAGDKIAYSDPGEPFFL